MVDKTKEYIKIDGANNLFSELSMLSLAFDKAIDKTHIISNYKKEKYHEIAKANALSLALLSDIQHMDEYFVKRAVPVTSEPKKQRGRPRKNISQKQTPAKQKKKKARRTQTETKAEKLKRMKNSLEALKKSLGKR